jgi:hypothetical protein
MPVMAERNVDTLGQLARALQEPIERAHDPARAKLQLATIYYCSKAIGTAEAARKLLLEHHIYEAWLLIRSLYSLAVDFLWMTQDPLTRAQRFYNGLAVALDQEAQRYEHLGILPAGVEASLENNRAHASSVSHQFTDNRGRIRPEWAVGTIRDRACAIVQGDPELEPLTNWYDLLYKKLSDFEHNGAALAFQYVDTEGDHLRAHPQVVLDNATAEQLGSVLGILIGLVFRAAINVGVLAPDAVIPQAVPVGAE